MVLYWILGFVLILAVVFALSAQLLTKLRIDSYDFFGRNSLLMYAGTLALLFVAVYWASSHSEVNQQFKLPLSSEHRLVSTAIILLSAISGLLLFKLEAWLISLKIKQQAQAHASVVPYWQKKWFVPVVVSIVLMEEIIWRAYLPLAIFQEWSLSLTWAAVISSLAFGLHHVFFGWIHVVFKSVYGFIWLLMTLSTESLIPAIIAHCAFNFAVYWHSANQTNTSIKGYKEQQG